MVARSGWRRARPITPEGVAGRVVSPDGKWLFIPRDGQTAPQLYSLDGGSPKMLDLAAGEVFAGWLADSRSVMLGTRTLPFVVTRLDIHSGLRTVVTTIAPADPDGITGAGGFAFAPDLDHYLYRYARLLGDLFVIDGLK